VIGPLMEGRLGLLRDRQGYTDDLIP